MLDPALPSSLSTVTTSSSATFSCLPPQRTIAYTRDLSFVALSLRAPARRWSPRRLACTSGPAQRATPDRQGYQTAEHPRTETVPPRPRHAPLATTAPMEHWGPWSGTDVTLLSFDIRPCRRHSPPSSACGGAAVGSAAVVHVVGGLRVGLGGERDDHAASVAALAGHREGLEQPRADPLPGHLDQAQRGHLGHLVLGPVPGQAFQQPAEHQLAVALHHPVDEVDAHDAPHSPQPHLPPDLL